MEEKEVQFYKLLNKYNELEYGEGSKSKSYSFFGFVFLFSIALIMNILFLILSFIDNEFYLLTVGAFFVLPSLSPLICYIIENNKAKKLFKKLQKMKEENIELLSDSKIYLEDHFTILTKNGYEKEKIIFKNKIELLYRKESNQLKIVHYKIFGINYLKAYFNNKSIKSICNKDKNTYGYTLTNNYSNILFLINKFIKNELI